MSALYDMEDFTDTDSEMTFMKRLDRKRKRRWEELRREADLTTVRESQGEYALSHRPGSSLRGLKGRCDIDEKLPNLFHKPDLSVVSADDADDIALRIERDKTEGRLV